MIGGWQDQLRPAGLAARAMATAAMRAHLRAGRDVIVPQYVRADDFVDELAALAADEGAGFVECAIVTDATIADARFAARAASGPQVHGDLGGDRMADVLVELGPRRRFRRDAPAAWRPCRWGEAFLATRRHLTWIGGADQGVADVLDQLDAAVASARPQADRRR